MNAEESSSSASSNEGTSSESTVDAEHMGPTVVVNHSEQPLMYDGVQLYPKTNPQHRKILHRMQEQLRQRKLNPIQRRSSTTNGTNEPSTSSRGGSSQSQQKRHRRNKELKGSESRRSSSERWRPSSQPTQPTAFELSSDLKSVMLDPINNVMVALDKLSADIFDISKKVDRDTQRVDFIDTTLDKQQKGQLKTDTLARVRSNKFGDVFDSIDRLKDGQQAGILKLNELLGSIEEKMEKQKTELEAIKLQLGDTSPVTSLAKRAVLGVGEVTVFVFKAFLFIIAFIRDSVIQPLIATG